MKKVLCVLFALLMCSALAVNVYAAPDRLVDGADLLNSAEEQALRARLDEVSKKHEVDIVVVTVKKIDGVAWDYAESLFLNGQYGQGKNKDCVIMLFTKLNETEEKEVAIFTHGLGEEAISDSDASSVIDEMASGIESENYVGAFNIFVDECDERIGDYIYNKTHFAYVKKAFIALIIGFIVALIATSVMKGKLKSVHYQSAATNYVKAGSLKITDSKDTYLYSTVSRVAKPKNNSSGGGSSRSGGGGASRKF